ncbi:MAG: MFS transporter, partial [Chloroflexota bacterium]|nr:MFS transporter [Chloroflexota bacterium]
VFVVGSSAEAAAQTLYWLLAACLVVGFGIGAASFIGPLYIAEIAPKNIRGRLAHAAWPRRPTPLPSVPSTLANSWSGVHSSVQKPRIRVHCLRQLD